MANTINQISVFLENKPGTLLKVLDYLEEKEVNILSLNISETDKYGIMRIIVEDPEKVLQYLQEKNYVASLAPVFVIPISNNFGSLKDLIQVLSNENINVEYMYSMAYFDVQETALMAIAVDDVQKAQDFFDAHNIEVYTPEE